MTISITRSFVLPCLIFVLLNFAVGFHYNIKILLTTNHAPEKRQILCHGVNVNEVTGEKFFLVDEANIDIGQDNKMTMTELKNVMQSVKTTKVEIWVQLGDGAEVKFFNTVRDTRVDTIEARLRIFYEEMELETDQSGASKGTENVVWSGDHILAQLPYVTLIHKHEFKEERLASKSIFRLGNTPGTNDNTNLPLLCIQLPTDEAYTSSLLPSLLSSPPKSWTMFLPRRLGTEISDSETFYRLWVVNAFIDLPKYVNFEYKLRTTEMIMKIERFRNTWKKETLTLLLTATVNEYRHKLFFRKPSISVFPNRKPLPNEMKTVQGCLDKSNDWGAPKVFVTYSRTNQTREITATKNSDWYEIKGSVDEEDEVDVNNSSDQLPPQKVLVMNYTIVGGEMYWP